MSRISYSEEEDFPGQASLWHANCARSLTGRAGLAALRELEAALVALPSKRLIADALDDGKDCCAIGAVVRQRGLDPAEVAKPFDIEFEMAELGESLGIPRLVAWKMVEWNDIDAESYTVRAPGPNKFEWPEYTPGYRLRVETTPEERYALVLKAVRHVLAKAGAA